MIPTEQAPWIRGARSLEGTCKLGTKCKQTPQAPDQPNKMQLVTSESNWMARDKFLAIEPNKSKMTGNLKQGHPTHGPERISTAAGKRCGSHTMHKPAIQTRAAIMGPRYLTTPRTEVRKESQEQERWNAAEICTEPFYEKTLN